MLDMKQRLAEFYAEDDVEKMFDQSNRLDRVIGWSCAVILILIVIGLAAERIFSVLGPV